MKEIKNNLPKYWVVKLTEENKDLFRTTEIKTNILYNQFK